MSAIRVGSLVFYNFLVLSRARLLQVARTPAGPIQSSVEPAGPSQNRTISLHASGETYIPGVDGTYAQNYQDSWVAAVAHRNQWANEFFLDIGAFHGIQCSNSALLEKKYGWRGICVEPTPYADFSQRSCALVRRAVGDVTGKVVRFTGGGQRNQRALAQVAGSIFDVATITSSDVLSCVNGTAPGSTDCGGISKHLAIPSFIAFASVDVEGMQMDVLNTFPWDEVKVAVWIIENDQPAARALMMQRGYLKAPVQNPGVDEYYILPQYWDPALAEKAYRSHPAGSYGC